jgi:hypothetical protein
LPLVPGGYAFVPRKGATVSTGEWDAPREDDDVETVDPEELDEVPPGTADEEGASDMRGGTTEGGWSNVTEEGGASGPGVGASPPGTDL